MEFDSGCKSQQKGETKLNYITTNADAWSAVSQTSNNREGTSGLSAFYSAMFRMFCSGYLT